MCSLSLYYKVSSFKDLCMQGFGTMYWNIGNLLGNESLKKCGLPSSINLSIVNSCKDRGRIHESF